MVVHCCKQRTHSVNSISFPFACEGCGVGGGGCGVGGDDSVFITYLLSEPVVCEGVPPTARWNLDTSSYS